jgi:hypothetical protein
VFDLIQSFLNYFILLELSLIDSSNLKKNQLLDDFFGCKNRICHHELKLSAENNG